MPPTPPGYRSVRARRSSSVPSSVTITTSNPDRSRTNTAYSPRPPSLKPCKAASAEFAPEQALDPLWISYWEPFHGAAKKDFGFQITIKVAPETETGNGTKDKP